MTFFINNNKELLCLQSSSLFDCVLCSYSDDHEPVHVHVTNGGREAKYNVQPVKMVYNHGFKKHELSLIESIVEEERKVHKFGNEKPSKYRNEKSSSSGIKILKFGNEKSTSSGMKSP